LPDRQKINNLVNQRPRVLISPLDWGLGHTTRCLPIIKSLLANGADVVVACNEKQAHLLRSEIPELVLLPLKGYSLTYSRITRRMWWKIFWQIPKILTAINREKKWLKELLDEEKFDCIFSDNRYGFRHPNVYSIFITHQLRVSVPLSKWIERQLQKWNYALINKFDECWIPDLEMAPGLAGELSHPKQFPSIKTKYIGVLSRFANSTQKKSSNSRLLLLLSGPEPQRTILENELLLQLKTHQGDAVIARGLPGNTDSIEVPGVTVFNHLPSGQLLKEIESADFIISRSGYSTVMDIVSLQKKSILIPTPGQTEQEYLAKFLMNHNLCVSFQQRNFNLEAALKTAAGFEYHFIDITKSNLLEEVIHETLQMPWKETVANHD
jgi:UDP:flavonoid glycosyltransferase YjiC (YdhE family)